MTSPLTVLFDAVMKSPSAVDALAPLSSIFNTASLPMALVLGEAPGWV